MKTLEPHSCPDPSLFFIGRNSRGNWIVQDQSGSRGGIFIDRSEALRFAMFENGRRPQAVVMVPGILDIDLGAQKQESRKHAARNSSSRAQTCWL